MKENFIIIFVLIAVLAVGIGISYLLPEKVSLGILIAVDVLILAAEGGRKAESKRATKDPEQPQAETKAAKQNTKTRNKK